MVDFGNTLRELRITKGLTQSTLAKRLRVSSAVVSAYENGIRYPSYHVLIRIAMEFNVTTDYLLGVEKKQTINVNGLTPKQVALLTEMAYEFKLANKDL